jgi:hypothetical protein
LFHYAAPSLDFCAIEYIHSARFIQERPFFPFAIAAIVVFMIFE